MNDGDTEQIGIRVPPGTKARIQEHIGYGRPYRDLTTFILAAIDEKLDPVKRHEIIKQELWDLKQRDPEFFRQLCQ